MKFYTKTNFYSTLVLIFALLIAFVLCSCMNYKKAKAKYADVKKDSIIITKIVTIPHDSIRTEIIHDTTTYIKEFHQGRARLIIEKTPTITYIKADCDSVSKVVQIKAPQEIITWGIAPWYRDAFLVLLGLVLALVLYIFIKKKSTQK